MEVVVPRVAAALVEERDVPVALVARQLHTALLGDERLGRHRVDAAIDVALAARAAERREHKVLARREACLEGAVDIFAGREVLAGRRLCERGGRAWLWMALRK